MDGNFLGAIVISLLNAEGLMVTLIKINIVWENFNTGIQTAMYVKSLNIKVMWIQWFKLM